MNSHLTPGGYIEQAELSPVLKSSDDSIRPGDFLDQCGVIATRASEHIGKSLLVESFMQEDIAAAGFVDVVKTTYKWPIGAWSNDPRLKELGKWNLLHWQQGLESWTLRIFTKHLGVRLGNLLLPVLAHGRITLEPLIIMSIREKANDWWDMNSGPTKRPKNGTMMSIGQ